MVGSRVLSFGHYQPSKVLTNADLEHMVDTDDEWIQSRVGIRTRRVAAADESVSDLATKAAEHALANAGLTGADIDFVIVATCTALDRSPNMAARVAAAVGAQAPAAIDVNTACSGFPHAMALADQSIRTGSATKALVIGVEKLTDFVDWTDRTTCVLIGDGAGAAVVVASEEPEISPVVWGSVPEMGRAVRIEAPSNTFAQEGQSVYRWATTALPEVALQVCERAGVKPEELGGVVLHQANLRIIEPLARKIGAVNAVIAKDVVESGNTSAASIPLALSKLIERGEIRKGSPVLLFAFGGGLSYSRPDHQLPVTGSEGSTAMTSSRVPWWPLMRLREAVTAPRARLLVFPHSGSGPNSLFPLVEPLPEDVEVLGLSLPGRERRFGEPPGCLLTRSWTPSPTRCSAVTRCPRWSSGTASARSWPPAPRACSARTAGRPSSAGRSPAGPRAGPTPPPPRRTPSGCCGTAAAPRSGCCTIRTCWRT